MHWYLWNMRASCHCLKLDAPLWTNDIGGLEFCNTVRCLLSLVQETNSVAQGKYCWGQQRKLGGQAGKLHYVIRMMGWTLVLKIDLLR